MKVNTDLLPINYDKELLKRRRPWYWLALLLFVFSLFLQQPLLFLTALFTILVAIVPDLWYRNALRHLVVRQYVNHRNVFFGEEVTLSVSIENHKFLPLPWLKVRIRLCLRLLSYRKKLIGYRTLEEKRLPVHGCSGHSNM